MKNSPTELYLFTNASGEQTSETGQPRSKMRGAHGNKLIIGDSNEVLGAAILTKFKNRIKMVYIDPPYNTKALKSYNDNIHHEKWKSAISRVLTQLVQYLQADGVIFISIDDSEYANLKTACDSIFGRVNFVGTFITHQSQRSNSKFINTVHEYILCYAKDKSALRGFSLKRLDIPEQREMICDIMNNVKLEMKHSKKSAEYKLRTLIDFYCDKYEITWLKNYNCVDNAGEVFFASDLSVPGAPRAVDIAEIGLHLEPLKTRGWISDKSFIELHRKGLLVFRNGRPYCKKYLKDAEDNAPSILNFYSRFGTKDLNKLGLRDLFDTPKPVELIKFLIRIAHVKSGEFVLDCYAGSGTTGQAVLEVNKEDSKDVRFILIQSQEYVSKKSRIYESCKKYGIKPVVSEIAKLRLDRVYEKLKIKSDMECFEYP